nr:MAG TPA: hypothetical protein [Caudoviricetes sp.]
MVRIVERRVGFCYYILYAKNSKKSMPELKKLWQNLEHSLNIKYYRIVFFY